MLPDYFFFGLLITAIILIVWIYIKISFTPSDSPVPMATQSKSHSDIEKGHMVLNRSLSNESSSSVNNYAKMGKKIRTNKNKSSRIMRSTGLIVPLYVRGYNNRHTNFGDHNGMMYNNNSSLYHPDHHFNSDYSPNIYATDHNNYSDSNQLTINSNSSYSHCNQVNESSYSCSNDHNYLSE